LNTLAVFVLETSSLAVFVLAVIMESTVVLEKEPDLLSFNIVTDKRRYILTAENAECYGNWSNALEPKKVKATPTKAQRQKLGCGTVLFDFKPQSGETHQLGVSAGKEKLSALTSDATHPLPCCLLPLFSAYPSQQQERRWK
jgi:hypothetical protein